MTKEELVAIILTILIIIAFVLLFSYGGRTINTKAIGGIGVPVKTDTITNSYGIEIAPLKETIEALRQQGYIVTGDEKTGITFFNEDNFQ